MADQARGHGVEAARGGDADAEFLVIRGALARQGHSSARSRSMRLALRTLWRLTISSMEPR